MRLAFLPRARERRVLPDRFETAADAVAFWRAVWEALRLDERYIPLEALDTYDLAPGVSGE